MIAELASRVSVWSQLLTFTDYIDILLLFFIFYIWVRWVQREQPHLVLFLYGYSAIGVISYFLSLLAVCTVFLYSAPFCILLLSWAALYKKISIRSGVQQVNASNAAEWLAEFMRALFAAKSVSDNFACLIDLTQYAYEPDRVLIATPFHYRLGAILFEESQQHARSCWHFAADGKLVDVGAPFAPKGGIVDWCQFTEDALLYTSTVAGLILIFNYSSRTFTLIVKGKRYENVETASVVRMVNRLMEESQSIEKGQQYEKSSRPTMF